MVEILLVDNNDSFTANLEHLLVARTQGRPVTVPYARLPFVDISAYDLAVISPGPGKPAEYPDYSQLLDCGLPVLGVCLGMQIINEYFGGATGRLHCCIHGMTDRIEFEGRPVAVARYHSLYLSRVAGCLEVIAVNAAGIPMAVRHRNRRILGYQFHPESFLTQDGGEFIDYAVRFFGQCHV